MSGQWGAAGAVLLAFMLTACGGPSAEEVTASKAASDEAVFLEQWGQEFPGAKADAAIDIAKEICDSYRSGTSFRSEVDHLVSMGASHEQAGAMIGMATVTYCPDFQNRR